jgi:hypothetical protein
VDDTASINAGLLACRRRRRHRRLGGRGGGANSFRIWVITSGMTLNRRVDYKHDRFKQNRNEGIGLRTETAINLDFSRNSVAGALIYAKVPVLQGIMGRFRNAGGKALRRGRISQRLLG